MKVFSQLISAQLEHRTSDYASSAMSKIWFRTDVPVVKLSDGTTVRTVIAITTPAKGDIYSSNGTTPENLAVGTNGQVLMADSTQTLGVKWATNTVTETDQSYEISNLTLTASVAASALTIALKTKAASDASAGDQIKIGFRSATSAIGTYAQRSVTAALSVVVSSGSTLGHASAVAHYIYVYAIDNAGTVELAVSTSLFDEGSRVSTTAEGGAGAADSNAVMYSTTARTNVGCRLIGRLLSTQGTAGTWATAISEISLVPFQNAAVAAHYETTDATSFSSNGTIINFTTKVIDTHNAFTTGAAAKFTAPVAGLYAVSCSFKLNGSQGAVGTYSAVEVFKNGSVYETLTQVIHWVAASAVDNKGLGGSTIIQLAIGDTVDIRSLSTNGTAKGTLSGDATANYISINLIK